MTALLAIVPHRCSFYMRSLMVVQVNSHAKPHLIQQSNVLRKAGRALFRKGNFGLVLIPLGEKKENMQLIFCFELPCRGVPLFPECHGSPGIQATMDRSFLAQLPHLPSLPQAAITAP